MKRTLGDSSQKLVSRLAWGILLGPVFAWYLLARGVKGIVDLAEPKRRYYVEFKTTPTDPDEK